MHVITVQSTSVLNSDRSEQTKQSVDQCLFAEAWCAHLRAGDKHALTRDTGVHCRGFLRCDHVIVGHGVHLKHTNSQKWSETVFKARYVAWIRWRALRSAAAQRQWVCATALPVVWRKHCSAENQTVWIQSAMWNMKTANTWADDRPFLVECCWEAVLFFK